MSKTDLTTAAPHTIVVPDFLLHTAHTAAAEAGMTADDLAMPRLKLLQSLSKEVADGATAGKIYNSITGDEYDSVEVYSLGFKRKWLVATTDQSRDLIKICDDFEAAKDLVAANPGTTANESHDHLLVMADDPSLTPYAIGLANTALTLSRQWNTAIVVEHGRYPRPAIKWRLSVVKKKNTKGNWWFALGFEAVGTVDTAEKLDALVSLGHKLLD